MKAILNLLLSQKREWQISKKCQPNRQLTYITFLKAGSSETWVLPERIQLECTGACVGGDAHIYVCLYSGGQKTTSCYSPGVAPCAFETDSLIGLEPLIWLQWQTVNKIQRSCSFCFSNSEIINSYHGQLKKKYGFWRLNSGLHVYKEALNQVAGLCSPQVTLWRRITQSQWLLREECMQKWPLLQQKCSSLLAVWIRRSHCSYSL